MQFESVRLFALSCALIALSVNLMLQLARSMAPDLRQLDGGRIEAARVERNVLLSLAPGIRGETLYKGDEGFIEATKVFNASISSGASVVVRPRDTQDVVTAVQFAVKHALTFSVKSGGLNTAGWAVQGDLVLDMSSMRNVSIDLPEGFEPPRANGKRSADAAFGSRADLGYPRAPRRPSPRTGSGSESSRGSNTPSSRQSDSPASSTVDKGKGRAVNDSPPEEDLARYQGDGSAQLGMHSGSIEDLFKPLQSSRDLSRPPPPVVDQLDGSGIEGNSIFANRVSSIHGVNSYASDTATNSVRSITSDGVNGIDRSVPTAVVSFEAGATSRQLDAYTSQYGFHVPLGSYPTGMGLMTTGGSGFLSRSVGLCSDNLLEIELVLASGRVVALYDSESEEYKALDEIERAEQDELWWAHRGAGTSFGVITRMKAKAYRIGHVLSGSVILCVFETDPAHARSPFNPSTTPSLLRHWRDCSKGMPSELYTSFILTAGPASTSHVVVILMCWLGEPAEGENYLRALLAWNGERCILKDVEARTYLNQQESVVQVLSATTDCRWYLRSGGLSSLSDEVIAKAVSMFVDIPERSAWLFELAGGAIASPNHPPSCIAQATRESPFRVDAIHQWRLSTADEGWIQAAHVFMNEVVLPNCPGGPLPTFIERREDRAEVVKAFGGPEQFARLQAIKARYDQDALFRYTLWPSDEKDVYDYTPSGGARPAMLSTEL